MASSNNAKLKGMAKYNREDIPFVSPMSYAAMQEANANIEIEGLYIGYLEGSK